MKRLLALIAVLVGILPVVFSCGQAPSASGNGLVPPAANTVVKIEVDRIVNNPALKAAYSELVNGRTDLPQTADDALGQILNKTGLDLSNTSSALFFADIESTGESQNMYAGVIMSGSFNQSTLIAKVQEQAGQTLTTADYKGFTVYIGAQDKYEIVFVSQGQLVAGTSRAVRDTIDVLRGDQKALAGSVIDTVNRFGAAVVAAAFAPPEALRSQLGTVAPQSPLSLAAFQNIDTIGFSVDLPGLSVATRVDAHFTNSTSVQDAKDAITGLISIARGTTQEPNLKAILGNIQVSVSGSWLTIRETASATEIASLAGSLQSRE